MDEWTTEALAAPGESGATALAVAAPQAANAELLLVFDAIPDGLVVADQDRRITRVNAAFCEMTGFSPDELVGQTAPFSFWADGELERAERRYEVVDDVGKAPFEVTLRCWDGKLIEAAMSTATARDAAGNIVARVATFKDLTSAQTRARVERALRRVAEVTSGAASTMTILERVVSEVHDLLGVPMVSIVRFDRPDAATRVASAGAPEHLRRRGSLADQSATAARVAPTGRVARINDTALLDAPMAREHAAAGIRSSVSVPIMVDGELWGALTALADSPGAISADDEQLLGRFAPLVSTAITVAAAREELSLRSELLNLAHDAVVVREPGENRITFWNCEAESVYGYSAGEAIGRVAADLLRTVFPDSRLTVDAALTRDGRWHGELRHTRKDGTEIVVASRMALHRDSDGRPTAIIELNSDTTHAVFQARLERALREVAAASLDGEHDAPALFDLVSERVASLLGTIAATVVRFDGESGRLVGKHANVPMPDTTLLTQPGAASMVAATGQPGRVDDYAELDSISAREMMNSGLRSAVAVPVSVAGKRWGCIAVVSDKPRSLPAETETLLERFAVLVSVALANAETLTALQHQATTDGLTGLLNHRAYQQRLHDEHRRARRYQQPLSLVMFDLDDFKAVNDTHGHQVGDQVLKAVAHAFARTARAGDVVARIGGDEFAVIAPNTSAANAFALAERLRQAAASAVARLELSVTLSAGVTDTGAAGTFNDLAHLADGALYRAKRHGRDRTVRDVHGATDTVPVRDRRVQATHSLAAA